jgi:hypothetical protein
MKDIWRWTLVGVVGAWMLLVTGGIAAAAPETPPAAAPVSAPTVVSDGDKLQFTQKNAQAQMQELEDRMFHLAEVVKEAEPESATRLLLAFRQAREKQIMDQMKEVLDELLAKDLSHATEETKQVLVKLAELRNLLTATDLDFQLQLERLRKLQAAIRTLDQAIKEEKQQQSHSSNLAGTLSKGGQVKPATLDEAKKDQEKNRERTDDVARTVKELGNLDPAAKPLATASSAMSNAEKGLGMGKPGDASTNQAEATKKLQEARDELEKERQRVAEALQKQIKGVVIENLQDMLDRQVAVRHATETLSPRLAKDRAAVLQLQQLEKPEERIASICHETLDLVTETEFSVALPPALENLERNMFYVAGDLKGGRGDQRVIATEMGIEEDLQDLLDTFKSMTDGESKCKGCKGCKGNKNKLLAELKVVRMLQMRVNKATLDVDADAHRAQAAAELPPELREKIGKVRDGEGSTRDAMEKLHQQYGPGQPDEGPEKGEGTHENPL